MVEGKGAWTPFTPVESNVRSSSDSSLKSAARRRTLFEERTEGLRSVWRTLREIVFERFIELPLMKD
jgi:hypothetical protein